jgi:hypothetical protein
MPCAVLECHPASSCAALRGIEVSLVRKAEALQVAYVLEGEIGRLRIPERRAPRIAERLWQHTCCEIFIARPGVPGYLEFNLSPSGEWAAYAFTGYREGMSVVAVSPEIIVRRGARRLELEASIPTTESANLSIGLSAVIEENSGGLSYWALRHAPGKPDFHHPDAFAIELDEIRH